MGFDIGSIIGGSVGDAVKKIAGVFKADPTVVEQNKAELEKIQVELEEKILDATTRQIETVNATMQAEAKSEHWLQFSWRPIVGFTFCFVIINNYIVMPYFPSLHPIEIPTGVWESMLVVLGVASGTRGYQKIVAEKNK